MSSDLYWLPPPKDRNKNFVSYLKYEIGQYFDEEYNGGNMERMVGEELIPFLKGIVATGTKDQKQDAKNLIEAIDKYGEVELIIGW